MFNAVLKSVPIKTVSVGTTRVAVEYAAETTSWKRSHLAQWVKMTASLKALKIPLCPLAPLKPSWQFSETEHLSKKDSYPHYTTVWQDNNGKHITTKHLTQ
ncbi:hypothetical protein BCR34DRAFT_584025 [Clohesyomyces aquaticus]|uniref:Uncharacterized protein n=1 Tax=Clohesyomyces aquaticus TaxID=1231657 RepID=A0A1Y2A3M7_9PLEO|nr:hypothetical protein BCR34DRAFT_584025 [Clohesyomyces aquaticus]